MSAFPSGRTRTVTASDGVSIAVSEYGDTGRPTVVLVHGFPDNQSVWAGMVDRLSPDFHVVAYDVRGAGGSGTPRARDGYRITQLVDDLAAVIDVTSPGEAIHLMAHDWGSIQCWGAVTDSSFADRLHSFTSISGPSLDMAGSWLRNGRRHPQAFMRQCFDSWYIFAFQLPRLPEFAVRRGLVDAIVAHSARIGVPKSLRPPRQRRPLRDVTNGLELYRANLHRLLVPRPLPATCPVLVLAPSEDAHVTVSLALEAPVPYTTDLGVRVIPGNHWVVEQNPRLITSHFVEFVTAL